jgi:hypothetical protein
MPMLLLARAQREGAQVMPVSVTGQAEEFGFGQRVSRKEIRNLF